MLASDRGVYPAYVENKENHGLCFFIWHQDEAVGAQCENCNTIVWLDPRLDKTLSEVKPFEVPDSGIGYTEYYEGKIERFLNKLPDCPSCGQNSYDRFVSNTSYPRYSDGTEFDDNDGHISLINEDPENIEIWWLNQN